MNTPTVSFVDVVEYPDTVQLIKIKINCEISISSKSITKHN